MCMSSYVLFSDICTHCLLCVFQQVLITAAVSALQYNIHRLSSGTIHCVVLRRELAVFAVMKDMSCNVRDSDTRILMLDFNDNKRKTCVGFLFSGGCAR